MNDNGERAGASAGQMASQGRKLNAPFEYWLNWGGEQYQKLKGGTPAEIALLQVIEKAFSAGYCYGAEKVRESIFAALQEKPSVYT